MARRETHGLGEVWKSRRIKRVLFFTYRFDFRWFHNFVLPKIRASSTLETEILVIASISENSSTRRGYGHDWGDQYEIRNWFAWEDRFKVVYLPSIPIFHAKFIAIQRESEISLGMGSSNLTRAGWETNFETWNWNCSGDFQNVLTTLEELTGRRLLDPRDVAPWITAIKEIRARTSKHKWLIPRKKANLFSETIRLLKKAAPEAKLIRIVSPYFDVGSVKLVQEIVSEFALDVAALEFWIDRTGLHTTGPHLRNLISLCEKMKIESVRFPVRVVRKPAIIREDRPLHAKLLEVLNNNGSGARVIGSANFTWAAWNGSNLESVFVENFGVRADFASLLPDGFDIERNRVSIAELKKEAEDTTAMEGSFAGADDDPVIYWAVFDERLGELKAHFKSDVALESFHVEAHHNPIRDTDKSIDGRKDIERLKLVAQQFSNSRNWLQLPDDKGFLRARLEIELKTPEWIRLSLRFSNGTALKIPIMLARPQFQSRDPETGIPKELNSIADLFGHAPPFVRPAGPTQIEPDDIGDNDDDDEMDNPEDQDQAGIELGSLSENPEYNHLPESIKVIKRLQRTKYEMEPDRLIRDLVGISKKTRSPRQRLLAKALIEVLRGKS